MLKSVLPGSIQPSHGFENASLELEEVRAVFRALHSGLIRPVWLNERIFTDRVREHLGLVLRQQRGRFLQDYIY